MTTVAGLSAVAFGGHGVIAGLTVNILHDSVKTGTKASPGTSFGGNTAASDQFFDACTQAKADIEALFCQTRSITINIQVDYQQFWFGSLGWFASSAGGAENKSNGVNATGIGGSNQLALWTPVRNALIANALTSEALAAANSLPTGLPTSSPNFSFTIHAAHLRQLGLSDAGKSTDLTDSTTGTIILDGVVALNNRTAHSLRHEITEIMGRVAAFTGFDGGYSLMSAFFYSGAGNSDVDTGPWTSSGHYFSVDNGTTNGFAGGTILAHANITQSAGDLYDWNGVDDPNDDCNFNGGINFTLRTKHCMDCLGWQWNGL